MGQKHSSINTEVFLGKSLEKELDGIFSALA